MFLDYTSSFQKRCQSFPAVKLGFKSPSSCFTHSSALCGQKQTICTCFVLYLQSWHIFSCIDQGIRASSGFPNVVRSEKWLTKLR